MEMLTCILMQEGEEAENFDVGMSLFRYFISSYFFFIKLDTISILKVIAANANNG